MSGAKPYAGWLAESVKAGKMGDWSSHYDCLMNLAIEHNKVELAEWCGWCRDYHYQYDRLATLSGER